MEDVQSVSLELYWGRERNAVEAHGKGTYSRCRVEDWNDEEGFLWEVTYKLRPEKWTRLIGEDRKKCARPKKKHSEEAWSENVAFKELIEVDMTGGGRRE